MNPTLNAQTPQPWDALCLPRSAEAFDAGRDEDAGVPINYFSFSNLTTTSQYLNINRRGLHLASQRYEDSRQDPAEVAHNHRTRTSHCATA